MKKISYLLASAMSALAALTAGAATAKTGAPEVPAGQTPGQGSANAAANFQISPAAKYRIIAQARPAETPGTRKIDVPKAGGKVDQAIKQQRSGTAKQWAEETWRESSNPPCCYRADKKKVITAPDAFSKNKQQGY